MHTQKQINTEKTGTSIHTQRLTHTNIQLYTLSHSHKQKWIQIQIEQHTSTNMCTYKQRCTLKKETHTYNDTYSHKH